LFDTALAQQDIDGDLDRLLADDEAADVPQFADRAALATFFEADFDAQIDDIAPVTSAFAEITAPSGCAADAADDYNDHVEALNRALTYASFLSTAELPPPDECTVFKGVLTTIAGDSNQDAAGLQTVLGANYNDSSKANFDAAGLIDPDAADTPLPGAVPDGCDASAEIAAF
jgi:hypothetical protein